MSWTTPIVNCAILLQGSVLVLSGIGNNPWLTTRKFEDPSSDPGVPTGLADPREPVHLALMSLMSFAGLAVYAATFIAALSAARRSWLYGRPRAMQRRWLGVASGFVVLFVLRLVNAEDLARTAMRQWMRGHDLYDLRRLIQAPLAIIVLIATAATAYAIWHFWLRKPATREVWLQRIALLALGGFVPLFALRLVSLHAIDKLLYSGPLRLNWILDLGLCSVAALCALAFAQIVKRRPDRSSTPRDRLR